MAAIKNISDTIRTEKNTLPPAKVAPTSVYFDFILPSNVPVTAIEADFSDTLTVQEAAARRNALVEKLPKRDFVDIDLPSDL